MWPRLPTFIFGSPKGSLKFSLGSSLGQDPLEHHLEFRLQSQAIADSIHRTYLAGVRGYITFCTSRQWQSFPARESTLRYFAACLANEVSYRTVKLYMASIRFFHIENNHPDSFQDAPLLHLLLWASPPNATFPSPCLFFGNSSLNWDKHLTSFHVTNSCFGPPSHWPSSLSYIQVS